MTARKTKVATPSGEELGLKLLQSVRETLCACCNAGVPLTTAMLCVLIHALAACGLRTDARLFARLLLSAVTGVEFTTASWVAEVAGDSERLFKLLHGALTARARLPPHAPARSPAGAGRSAAAPGRKPKC